MSTKRKRQQDLYIAIGTIKGFAGYLNNLEYVINRAHGRAIRTPIPEIESLRKALPHYEAQARVAIKSL